MVWGGFFAFVLLMIALDLGVFHRKAHAISLPEALAWSGFWVALALAFNLLVYFLYENNWVGVGLAFPVDKSGMQAALEFFTGYVLEKSLSLDNIFVIAVIFSYFGVPLAYQHRVLFWGVLGALVMRGIMIGAGVALIHRFDWIVYVFGTLLLFTAIRMLVTHHDHMDPERDPVVRLARRIYPMTEEFDGQKLFTRIDGRRVATPLFVVLVLVESTDLLFAVDSIPAIFAVTSDPFIVYSSNVFAVLGLRSLYFVLAPLLGRFRYLKTSLVFILAFVGVKMLLSHHYPIPIPVSLGMILGILAVGVGASVAATHLEAQNGSPVRDQMGRLLSVSFHTARRVVVLVVGSTVVLMGAAMLVLPGPGIVAIPAGIAILATEFLWARRILATVRRGLRAGARRVPWPGGRRSG